MTWLATARLLCLAAIALGATGCGAHSSAHAAVAASPLGAVAAKTPRFPVARFATYGTFTQFRDGKLALGAVNRALRDAIVADQRAFAPYARHYVATHRLRAGHAGYYETELDRTLVSASTVVVSMLIPRSQDVLPAQPPTTGLRGWLGITIRVPSGTRVTLPELFARPAQAMRVLEARVRADKQLAPAVRRHASAALANPQFALLPTGLAIGVVEVGWRDTMLVPYSALRTYLSPLGRSLVAGARWADFRRDHAHFSYCRRPDNSGAELSATGDVPCASVRKVEAAVFSARCDKRNRCVALGFTCLAYWDDRYNRPFQFTHHAICHDGKRRIVMDEG